jgi:hypothetical protein
MDQSSEPAKHAFGAVIQEAAKSVSEDLMRDTNEQMPFASDCGGSVTLVTTMILL